MTQTILLRSDTTNQLKDRKLQMRGYYAHPKSISSIDYTRAFRDPWYGQFVEDDHSEYESEESNGQLAYSDDEEVSTLVQNLRNYNLSPAAKPSYSRVGHQQMNQLNSSGQLDFARDDYETSSRARHDYFLSPAPTPSTVSNSAMDFAHRFVDLLLQMEQQGDPGQSNQTGISHHQDYASSDSGDLQRYSKTISQEHPHKLCKFIYKGLVGRDFVLEGPFGTKNLVYCDFTASGKPLKFIEQYIKDYVLPMYANTHSESSDSAMQTNKYREDAREIIKNCVNGSDKDVVIFTGSGSTSAIAKMIQVLKTSSDIDFGSVVVVVAAYEHHSNLLPWENAKVKAVIRIPLNKNGLLDMKDLAKQCAYHHSRGYIIIGSISAASNVTGIVTDTDQVAEIIHYYDGYAFFDYACGAPYLKMDMNPRSAGASKDAIFISVHKFVGGPQTPGLLVAKRFLFSTAIPSHPAGGTVAFVSRSIVQYVEDPVAREEGGTPEIIGSIRAGLAFKLKASVSESYIHAREGELVKMFIDHFRTNRLISILGSLSAERLPIFSFVVHHPHGKLFIHHNFIGLLLNDLFGVQSRPGCACAGPYAMELLNVDEAIAVQSAKYFTKCQQNKISILKQGFVRINLPYFYPQRVINFIINAVEFVVNYGWYFLPQYTYSAETGFWMHRHFQRSFSSLSDISYSERAMKVEVYEGQKGPLEDPFVVAHRELRRAKEMAASVNFSADPPILLDDGDENLRWFLLPHEAAYFIMNSDRSMPRVPL